MQGLPSEVPGERGQAERWDVGVGLGWLIQLRFGALLCALLTTLVSTTFFGTSLPFMWLGSAFVLLLLSNIGLLWRARNKGPVSPALYGAVLLFDLSVFTAVLFVTGGSSNPFTIIYLVHVALAAVVLGSPWTWVMAAFASACFGLLFLAGGGAEAGGMHGGMHGGHGDQMYGSHLQGMWFAFVLTAVLIAHFIGKVVSALREREQQIHDLRELALRNAQLAEMTTLAAGAAHELASPLSTITVVARELQLAAQKQELQDWQEDAELIGQEARRCRSILDRMGAGSGDGMGPEQAAPLQIDSLLGQLKLEFPRVDLEAGAGVRSLSIVAPPNGLSQVLSTLLSNAFDASEPEQRVVFRVKKHGEVMLFEVEDEGVGMDPELLRRAVSPFYSTKEAGQGMGLGLFIAWTFAEQSGGKLRLESKLGEGSTVILELPLGHKEG